MGGGSKSVKTKVERKIPPPTAQETQLLGDLMNISTTDYYRPSASLLNWLSWHHYRPSGWFRRAVHEYYQPSQEFVETMKNPYLSMLPYKEKIGETLNTLAARGVLNSTITQNALDKASRWMAERALEAKTQTLANLERMRLASAEDMWRRALGLEEARRYAQADALKRKMLAETLKRESLADRYNRLYRLWHTMYSGRLGTAPTVTTQPMQSQWGQVIGSAVGTGLGYWLGQGGGFQKIGSAVKNVWGKIF